MDNGTLDTAHIAVYFQFSIAQIFKTAPGLSLGSRFTMYDLRLFWFFGCVEAVAYKVKYLDLAPLVFENIYGDLDSPS